MAKRGAVPASLITASGFTQPTHRVRYLPPLNWNPAIHLLESPAINGARELPTKSVKGASEIVGKKLNQELEPSDVQGHLHMAAFGQDTVIGDGATVGAPHAHNFEVLQQPQLPVYDFYYPEGDKQFGFAAMMCKKWELMIAKKEVTKVDMEWDGLYFVDDLTYDPLAIDLTESTVRPLPFAVTDTYLGGSLVTNLQKVNLILENSVQTDHALRSDTNQASQIWCAEAKASGSLDQYFTDKTEYDKFLAMSSPSTPTPSDLKVVLTSDETFDEGSLTGIKYRFIYQMPLIKYRTAEIQLPQGVVLGTFTFVCEPDDGEIGESGDAYTFHNRSLVCQFRNGVAAAY